MKFFGKKFNNKYILFLVAIVLFVFVLWLMRYFKIMEGAATNSIINFNSTPVLDVSFSLLKAPVDLDIDNSGNLWIADSSSKKLLTYDCKSNPCVLKDSGIAIADNAVSFSIDKNSNFIVGTSASNGVKKVFKYDSTGNSSELTGQKLAHANKNGTMFSIETDNNKNWNKINKTENGIVKQIDNVLIDNKNYTEGAPKGARLIKSDNNGNMFLVSNDTVNKPNIVYGYDIDSNETTYKFDFFPNAQNILIVNFDVDDSGTVYVVGSYQKPQANASQPPTNWIFIAMHPKNDTTNKKLIRETQWIPSGGSAQCTTNTRITKITDSTSESYNAIKFDSIYKCLYVTQTKTTFNRICPTTSSGAATDTYAYVSRLLKFVSI